MGFLHIQGQLQLAFQKGTALLADGLGMGLRPFVRISGIVSGDFTRW
jgi:hypothetical protein